MLEHSFEYHTAQKNKFSVTHLFSMHPFLRGKQKVQWEQMVDNFFSKCDQIRKMLLVNDPIYLDQNRILLLGHDE